jgi:hypothetical protein
MNEQGAQGEYWAAELAAVQAVEEIRAIKSKNGGDGGGPAQSTATSAAYINSVEELTPCNYGVKVCSDLVCRNTGRSQFGAQQAGDNTHFFFGVSLIFICLNSVLYVTQIGSSSQGSFFVEEESR